MTEWTWIVRSKDGEEDGVIEEILATPNLAADYIATAEADGATTRRVKVEAGHDWSGRKFDDPFFIREINRIIAAGAGRGLLRPPRL